MSAFPHRDLAAALAVDDVAVYAGWPTEVVAPCIVVSPQGRTRVPPCHVEWSLRLSVGAALSQESEVVHEITEQVIASLPAGYVAGDTSYTQRSIGGIDMVWADTAIIATR